MPLRIVTFMAALLPVLAQSPQPAPQPLYRVTIVQRTTPAINYSHRSEPTKIDFRGSPLLPQAHGEATVESKRGAVLVDAHFEQVPPPTRFGAEYLTYVVWAISPEGRARNLGELVVNGSNKGRLKASTEMQAFALIVTAEPYFSVSQPSDVVVMENVVRPDTVGKVEQVNATYELLPRKPYTYTVQQPAAATGGASVSMEEYEAVTAIYQAQNAIQIARAAGADRYATDRLARAEQLLEKARQLPPKRLSEEVVATAREAAQTAEDARVIAMKRSDEERIAKERAETTQMKKEVEAERADALAARGRAQQETARAAAYAEQAREQMESQKPAPAPAPAVSTDRLRIPPPANSARDNRARLLQRLNTAFETRDTPRGLVLVIPGSMFGTPAAIESIRGRLTAISSALTAFPDLRFEVDGYNDAGKYESVSQGPATRVRDMLTAQGIRPASITVPEYGSERPITSNSSAGREQNRRVEIVISGDAIGTVPTWDRKYSLESK